MNRISAIIRRHMRLADEEPSVDNAPLSPEELAKLDESCKDIADGIEAEALTALERRDLTGAVAQLAYYSDQIQQLIEAYDSRSWSMLSASDYMSRLMKRGEVS